MAIGTFEVVVGPMFSGKSTELIRKLTRAQIAGKRVLLLKPSIDNRYHANDVVSHDGRSFAATSVSNVSDLVSLVSEDGYDVVGFDEAQFFTADFHNLAEEIANAGGHVILAGLSTDFMGRPWAVMSPSIARADVVEHLTAVCVVCGSDATRNQRLVNGQPATSGELTAVGGTEAYEARCRTCFVES